MNLFNIKKSFEMKKANDWPEIYWCVDLHGTIIPSGKNSLDKTDEEKFYPDAREVLQWLTRRKDIFFILWTSTPPSRMGDVKEFLSFNSIRPNYINENPHAKDTPRSDFSKKFYFNVLLDDRAGFEPEVDWTAIKKELIALGEWY